MAALQSLGLHEPSALSYLINEGLLNPNPLPSSYKWTYQQTHEGTSYVIDEILQTTHCVVWSQNGIIKRVFNLDIEGEVITHAFTTRFSAAGNGRSLRSRWPPPPPPPPPQDRALVVIMKTQAHIFLLSGDTHVVPLSFEVQNAIPAAYGFVLQRKIQHTQLAVGNVLDDEGKSVKDVPSLFSANQPANLGPSGLAVHKFSVVDHEKSAKLPRTFSYSELLSEPSLVVSGSLRKHETIDTYPVLSLDEDVIYISTGDELQELQLPNSEPVYLALSVSHKTKHLTLWRVLFKQMHPEDMDSQRRTEKTRLTAKRKSSNVYGRQTGATTPIVRGPGTFRESLGGLTQSITESGMFSSVRDTTLQPATDFADQLGREFEQVGVQTRSARRVSSMLARTDLGGANDRSAFNEMATGTFGRKSFGRSIRRGESIGGFSDRQSFGARRRSSFQAASSIYSDGTSFLDIPATHLLDDGPGRSDVDIVGESTELGTASKLSRDVAFMKLKSLPYDIADDKPDAERQPLKVTTLLAPDRSTADDRRSRIISVCVMDRDKQDMTIVNVAAKVALPAHRYKTNRMSYDLKAVEVQRGKSIVDACPVVEDNTKRLLILTQTRDGSSVIHLEAPWSVSYRISLPTQFKIFDPSTATHGDNTASRREIGIHRVIPGSEINIRSLKNCEPRDQVLALDSANRCHRLRFRLTPTAPLVKQILQLCNLVLPPEFIDSILVAWWEVKRWIEAQGSEPNIEWTAMTVTLFVLAVPFISKLQSGPAHGTPRKKGGSLRSSSGTTIDLSSWELMQDIERTSTRRQVTATAAWDWIDGATRHNQQQPSPSKHSRAASRDTGKGVKKDTFLVRCTNLARDFLQSPAGESATGPEGYLPTAVNKDRPHRRTALASILVGLHLLREEVKLHELASSMPNGSSGDLASVIVQIASWLKWQGWGLQPGTYYNTEIRDPIPTLVETSVIDTLDTPAQPFEPPSIFDYVENVITKEESPPSFPSLLDLVSQTKPITQTHPLWKEAAKTTPRTFALTAFLSNFASNTGRKASTVIKHMLNAGIDTQVLQTIPSGIAAVFHQAIINVRGQPPAHWSLDLKLLLGRTDLVKGLQSPDQRPGLSHVNPVHEAVRDYHAICNSAIDTDSISRWDSFSELDRQAITRLIFRDDRRFQEASKLVNQTRPPLVECTPEPGWSEADLLEAQKELAVHVTRRTLSVAAGRAMIHFNARVPLLTERVPIPAFSLQCVMQSRGASDTTPQMTLSADKALFTEDKVCWAFFHNGASAGLMISRHTQWIDTSWILYNKPPELTNRHAGFLLALGLNGHLKSLAKWVAFKYLTPKHTMTSVGLLLGLAASYLGTMDTLIVRLLSVHVTRLLPPGAAELNLSPLTQMTGIMGVGLLYCHSQHRRMSEIMLSEMENSDAEDRTGDEPILRDEGYRLAAGFSLGLINLGRGSQLHSLHDMNVTERLLNIAIGTKNVNLVHVLDRATAGAVIAVAFIFMKTNNETIAQKIDIPDTMHQFDYVRPDIFLLRTLARHLIMWDGIAPTQEFIKASLPPAFRKRADLSSTKLLSTDDLPFFNVMAGICFSMSLRFAGSHRHDVRDLLVSYLDQFSRLARLPALNYDAKVTLNSVRNCLDVVSLSCAVVMAGSGDIIVMRRLRALHGRTDKDTPFGSHLAAHMALGVLFLSGGTATFGTSDLAVAALVISLYPLFPVDVLDNKGHLQALRHLWVLAVENRCLVARDAETQLVISDIEADIELLDGTRQKLKTPGLLPAFGSVRHVSFSHSSYWPVSVDLDSPPKPGFNSDGSGQDPGKKRPLSVREVLVSDNTGLKIYLQRRAAYEKPDADVFFSELQALDETRGVPSTDPNSGVNEKWRQRHGQGPDTDNIQARNNFNWIFDLGPFQHLDLAERSLVLDEAGSVLGEGKQVLAGNAVDAMLEFQLDSLGIDHHKTGAHGWRHHHRRRRQEEADEKELVVHRELDKDKLWQLRLLFAWADRWDMEEEEEEEEEKERSADNGKRPSASVLLRSDDKNKTASASASASAARWMKREVVEQLKQRVWEMADGE